MKKIILTFILLLTVSFNFAINEFDNNKPFFNKSFYLDNADENGFCWVQVIVTTTNTQTGESYTYTYWAYVGMASNETDCKKKAEKYVAGLQEGSNSSSN